MNKDTSSYWIDQVDVQLIDSVLLLYDLFINVHLMTYFLNVLVGSFF